MTGQVQVRVRDHRPLGVGVLGFNGPNYWGCCTCGWESERVGSYVAAREAFAVHEAAMLAQADVAAMLERVEALAAGAGHPISWGWV